MINATQPLSDVRGASRPVPDGEFDGHAGRRLLVDDRDDREESPQLVAGVLVPCDALHLPDHALGYLAFPGVEHLLEQRLAVGEVSIEPTLGHPEFVRQRLDPDGGWPAGGQRKQPLIDPRTAWSPGLRHQHLRSAGPPRVPTSVRQRTSGGKLECIRCRMDRATMKLQQSAHTDRPWRIHEIAPEFTVEDVWA